MRTFTENRYGDYRKTEQSNSIRASGATCGGGSEVLIVQSQFDEVRLYENEVCPTLKAEMGGIPLILLESNQNHATAKETEVCTTLPAAMGMGGGYVPMIVDTLVFDEGQITNPNRGSNPQWGAAATLSRGTPEER